MKERSKNVRDPDIFWSRNMEEKYFIVYSANNEQQRLLLFRAGTPPIAKFRALAARFYDQDWCRIVSDIDYPQSLRVSREVTREEATAIILRSKPIPRNELKKNLFRRPAT